MADFDFGGFNLDFGTDPFGGGSEGLTQFAQTAVAPDLTARGGGSPLLDLQALDTGGGTGQPIYATPSAPTESTLSAVARGLVGGKDPETGKDSGGVLGGLGGFAKGVLPFAQLGLAGAGIKSQADAAGAAKQQGKIQRQAQATQMQAIQPLTTFGTQQLQRAEAGKVDPSIQAMIDQWTQAAKQQAVQRFASMGITDSTMMDSIIRDIDAKAEAMKAGDIHLMEQMGVSALGQAASAAGGAAQGASQEQVQLDNLIAASNKALASIVGGMA